MCIDTLSLPNVSRYGDISIYCCISISNFIKKTNFMYLPYLNSHNVVLYSTKF